MKDLLLCLLFVPLCVQASNSSTRDFRRSLRPHVPAKDVGLPRGGTIYAFGHRASNVAHLPPAPWNKLPTLDDRISSIIGPREKLQHRRRNVTYEHIVNCRLHRASIIARENEQLKLLRSKQ